MENKTKINEKTRKNVINSSNLLLIPHLLTTTPFTTKCRASSLNVLLWLLKAGFEKNYADLSGLKKCLSYLKNHIIPELSNLELEGFGRVFDHISYANRRGGVNYRFSKVIQVAFQKMEGYSDGLGNRCKGEGYTTINLDYILALKSRMDKLLYLYLCKWQNVKKLDIFKIEQIFKFLQVAKYQEKRLLSTYLLPALKRLQKQTLFSFKKVECYDQKFTIFYKRHKNASLKSASKVSVLYVVKNAHVKAIKLNFDTFIKAVEPKKYIPKSNFYAQITPKNEPENALEYFKKIIQDTNLTNEQVKGLVERKFKLTNYNLTRP